MITEAAAAIIEPEPTPAPIARASGSKIPSEVARDAIRLTMMAPNTVPNTYFDSTPRYCGESEP